ncbi:chemotaxis protein methyltransferase CheR [Candidatus Magnetomoraceae bacterium gMMP-1]
MKNNTTQNISKHLLFPLSECIKSKIGLNFPKKKWRDLQRGINNAAKDSGFKDVDSFIHLLLSSQLTKKSLEILTDSLTIGETYFLRDKNIFKAFEKYILPELMRLRIEKKNLKIWTAGCCTGEEPYSVAMVIDKLMPVRHNWDITILASDINRRFLKKARNGIYTQWSFRNVPEKIKEKYFKKSDNFFEISYHIKTMVEFFHHNLIDGNYPSSFNNINDMDAIFCRNVLMYFSQNLRIKVIDCLARSLVTGGYLIINPGEAPCAREAGLEPVRISGITVYKKKGRQSKVKASITSEKSLKKNIEFHFLQSSGNKTYIPGNKNQKQSDKNKVQSEKDLYIESLSLYKKGQYKASSEKLTPLLKNDARAMILMAQICANLGNLDEAKKWCEKAINLEKFNPGHYYLMAAISHEQGLLEEAVKLLMQALYLDPDFVMAYFLLGNIKQKQRNLSESKKYFNNALSLMSSMDLDEFPPHSDGMTAGSLIELIRSMN